MNAPAQVVPPPLLTPYAVRIVEQYDDGESARHYTFEPLQPAQMHVEPGQFFMLTVPLHGEAPFTYAGLPDAQGRFQALVRKVGDLTAGLFALPTGTVLGARGPLGQGWPMSLLQGKRVLVLAGGCGLAPLASVIDALCARSGTRTVLVYGSRNEATRVLGRERVTWQNKLTVIETFDHPSQAGHRQGLPLSLLTPAVEALGAEPDFALVCGPEAMMFATASALTSRGLAPDRIFLSIEKRMHCGVGLCGHCYLAESYACKDGPTYRYDALQRLMARSPARAITTTEIRHC